MAVHKILHTSAHSCTHDHPRSLMEILLLNSAAISWQSVSQQVTALSSAEAEYLAASVAGTDVTYMFCVLEDLG
eukprot:851982-Rhodomonas_salina.2